MHYHLEVIMPHRDDVEAALEEILAPFSEHDDENHHAFHDYYVIGGRYSGRKLEAAVGQDKLDAFFKEIKKREVTVSGLVWGKQELEPASQIPMVDALWREMCPGGGDVCPIFKHSGETAASDICRFDAIPKDLKAFRLIVAAPDFEGEKFKVVTMLATQIWNGVTHQDTTWGGSVAEGVRLHLERIEHSRNDYWRKCTPQPDWLCVTVDYHC